MLTPAAAASASGWILAAVGVALVVLLGELRRFRQAPVQVEEVA
jgi:ENTS family enterobactin (siderophore) exporter